MDAANMTLGRLASQIASRLRGKHRTDYSPHTDCGDFVVVINSSKIHLSGNKLKNKIYYKHTGFVGHVKQESAGDLLGRKPEEVIEKAVWGMLPKGPLGRDMFKRLKAFPGAEHPHKAQVKKELKFDSATAA